MTLFLKAFDVVSFFACILAPLIKYLSEFDEKLLTNRLYWYKKKVDKYREVRYGVYKADRRALRYVS